MIKLNHMYSSRVGLVESVSMEYFESDFGPIIKLLHEHVASERCDASNPRGQYNMFMPSARAILGEQGVTVLRNFVDGRLSTFHYDFSIRFPMREGSSRTNQFVRTLEAAYYGFGSEICAAFSVNDTDWAYLMPTGWKDGVGLKTMDNICLNEEEIGDAMCQTMRLAAEYGWLMCDLKINNMIFKDVNDTWTARMIDFDPAFIRFVSPDLADCIEVLHCLLVLVPHTAALYTAPLGIYQVVQRLRKIRNDNAAALKIAPCLQVNGATEGDPEALSRHPIATLFLTQCMHYLRGYARKNASLAENYAKLIEGKDNTLESWINTTLELYRLAYRADGPAPLRFKRR